MALTPAEKQRAYRDRERTKLEALHRAANGAAPHGNVTDDDGEVDTLRRMLAKAEARIEELEAELARVNAAVVGFRQDNFRLASEVQGHRIAKSKAEAKPKIEVDRSVPTTTAQQKADADDHETDEAGNVTDLATIKAELDGLCMTITGMLKAPGEIDLYRKILPLVDKARPLVMKGVRKLKDPSKAKKARNKAWDDFLSTIGAARIAGGMTQLFIKAMRRHTGAR